MDKFKPRRVLRGGAYNNSENNLRCAYRNNNNPNNRNNNIGFRIVLSTFFPAGIARRSFIIPGRSEKWRNLFMADKSYRANNNYRLPWFCLGVANLLTLTRLSKKALGLVLVAISWFDSAHHEALQDVDLIRVDLLQPESGKAFGKG